MDSFRQDLLQHISDFEQALSTPEGDWTVKGFIDVYKFKFPLNFFVKLVGIRNFCQQANSHLRRQVELGANNAVCQFLQIKLAKFLGTPSHLANIVGSLIRTFHCTLQAVELFLCWLQFNLRCQLHTLFWFSIYCLTIDSDDLPTVATKYEFVQSVGRRLFSFGNSLRNINELRP